MSIITILLATKLSNDLATNQPLAQIIALKNAKKELSTLIRFNKISQHLRLHQSDYLIYHFERLLPDLGRYRVFVSLEKTGQDFLSG